MFNSNERQLSSIRAALLMVTCGTLTAHPASANPYYNTTSNRNAVASVQQSRVNRSIAVAIPAYYAVPTRNNLPPTRLDSFVRNAGGNAELIYGDEGFHGLPPYKGFSYEHRINEGIVGQNDAGLTTGHGSYLPSAWGADEMLAPPGEYSESGTNYGDPQLNNADALLNLRDQRDGRIERRLERAAQW